MLICHTLTLPAELLKKVGEAYCAGKYLFVEINSLKYLVLKKEAPGH